jgi:hypothetical protein
MERAILTPAGIGEALSALHSHRLTHCASLARLRGCPPVWWLGEQLDEFSSPEVVIEAVVAGLAFYLFLVQTFTARKPFVDPVIFRDRNFVLGLCFIFVVGIILLASLALITPHSAFFTPEAWDDTRLKAAETMRAALVGPRPQNVITPEMF